MEGSLELLEKFINMPVLPEEYKAAITYYTEKQETLENVVLFQHYRLANDFYTLVK